jgi:hypothetical protein
MPDFIFSGLPKTQTAREFFFLTGSPAIPRLVSFLFI